MGKKNKQLAVNIQTKLSNVFSFMILFPLILIWFFTFKLVYPAIDEYFPHMLTMLIMITVLSFAGIALLRRLFMTEQMKLETLVKHMEEGIILTDEKQRPVILNPIAHKMLNLDLGKNVTASGLSGSDVYKQITEIIKSNPKAIITNKEIKIKKPAGIVISLNSLPALDTDGLLAGRVTVLRDITAAKEIEAMKAEFAEKITSKLEDPLSSVRQTVDLLLDETAGPLTEDQKQFLFVARNDAGRVERILGDILNLSQLGSGNLKLDLEPVRVGELIETIIADFKTHAESKKINLSAKTGQRLHDLKADLTRSKQILSCLIDNAIKFSPNNEKVIVEAANHDEGILFTVTDTGIGIPAQDKEKIFEAWDDQQPSAGGSRQGSGLGLPLAKKLVEAHGRRMWVESKPGRGSKFSFILPKN